MGLLGHLARPLTPKSGAKAIVFLGRDNGLPWNAALDVRVGSKAPFRPSACLKHANNTPAPQGTACYSITSSARERSAGGNEADALGSLEINNKLEVSGLFEG